MKRSVSTLWIWGCEVEKNLFLLKCSWFLKFVLTLLVIISGLSLFQFLKTLENIPGTMNYFTSKMFIDIHWEIKLQVYKIQLVTLLENWMPISKKQIWKIFCGTINFSEVLINRTLIQLWKSILYVAISGRLISIIWHCIISLRLSQKHIAFSKFTWK